MSDGGSTLNIPQLLVIIVVSFLIFRWYNSSSAGSAQQRAPAGRNAQPRVNPAAVEQISQMFPQLNRRDIMWDLSRNGNNVAATTERVLGGRGLEAPTHPDLITRYQLANKIQSEEAAPTEEPPKKPSWSQNKAERQQNLQRRREEMILAARRKILEKEKAKSAQS
ncbi:AMFR protein [Neofusicoccum parvum]|uniref:Coupling of ubiquitin conjugation to ER degradation protein 1 n=1 Tax=Botryosphaeria parva (strain UCR-NP2) TaxID=1287680 RepID=R1FWL7_BOTPV|nr:putative amfr protein [Neofusicoccum parvum UCRNP2]GME52665.1 AMFR protein [Neofusicoccum parvum]